jgi:hypothetical protein
MIDLNRRYPGRGGMAVIAVVRSAYVSRVLACSSCSVMAAKACTCYSRMVEIRRYPAVRCMAVVTGVRGAYVSRILAYSSCSVMAAKA